MLNDVAIALVSVLILAASFSLALCHDCLKLRRHRSTTPKGAREEKAQGSHVSPVINPVPHR